MKIRRFLLFRKPSESKILLPDVVFAWTVLQKLHVYRNRSSRLRGGIPSIFQCLRNHPEAKYCSRMQFSHGTQPLPAQPSPASQPAQPAQPSPPQPSQPSADSPFSQPASLAQTAQPSQPAQPASPGKPSSASPAQPSLHCFCYICMCFERFFVFLLLFAFAFTGF